MAATDIADSRSVIAAREVAEPPAALPPYTRCVENFLNGSDTPRAYLERCIANIESLEPQIRAFVHLDADAARRAADAASERYRQGKPLSAIDGMPIGVKDIIDTREMPTQMNSPLFTGFQPRRDAACVVALKQAGAIIVGKTVTTEFACGRAGPTRNPHDLQRTPGGSSSGSAAAVAAGMLPAALGTQTQASIIRPASYCGVIGYKPTFGMLCTEGVGRLAPTLDHLGVLAADLGDARAVAAAIAAVGPDYDGVEVALGADADGAMTRLAMRPLRRLVRLEGEGWSELDAAGRQAFDQTLLRLAAQGVQIVDRSQPQVAQLERRLADASAYGFRIFAWEAQWPLRAYADCGSDLVGDRVKDLLALAAGMSARDYRDATAWRDELRAEVAALAGVVDAFASPASSGPATVGLEPTGSRTCAVPWTLVGGPAFSLPLQQVDGLPFGLQLGGFDGRDLELFGYANWLIGEQSQPA